MSVVNLIVAKVVLPIIDLIDPEISTRQLETRHSPHRSLANRLLIIYDDRVSRTGTSFVMMAPCHTDGDGCDKRHYCRFYRSKASFGCRTKLTTKLECGSLNAARRTCLTCGTPRRGSCEPRKICRIHPLPAQFFFITNAQQENVSS